MPLISLLHATRERQELMWKCRNEWWYKRDSGDASHDFEHIFSIDDDDPTGELTKTRARDGDDPKPRSLVISGMPPENNAAWNRAYAASDPSSKIIIQVSDDFEAPPNWNTVVAGRLFNAGGWDKPLVLGVGDPHFGFGPYSGDGACLTIYIVTRAYVEQCGHFMHPEYISMLSDDDVTMKACFDKVLVDSFDVRFAHHWHGSDVDPKRDSTYSRHHTNRCWNRGHTVYEERFWAGFPDIRTDADPDRNLADNETEFLAPPDRQDVADVVAKRRKERGTAYVQNKPPRDEVRKAWFAGDFQRCRDALVETVLKPYHMKICSGRFLAHGPVWMWNQCTKRLGDREMLGVHRKEWRDYLGNHEWRLVD